MSPLTISAQLFLFATVIMILKGVYRLFGTINSIGAWVAPTETNIERMIVFLIILYYGWLGFLVYDGTSTGLPIILYSISLWFYLAVTFVVKVVLGIRDGEILSVIWGILCMLYIAWSAFLVLHL